MPSKYTAIIYFHGIGTQRRHEEISRLLDAIDQFSRSQDAKTIGHPRGQKVKLEPSRIGESDPLESPISFIEFHRRVQVTAEDKAKAKADGKGEPTPFRGSFRVYEGYWSSLIAEGLSPRRVLKWIAGRAITPVRSLMAPWRSHQRLKLGHLFRLQRHDLHGESDHHSAYRQLAESYIAYEGWEARRNYKNGSFSSFLSEYLPNSRIAERKDFDFIRKLAKKWRHQFVYSQIRVLFFIATLFAGLIGAATFAVFSVAPLLSANILNLPYAEQVVSLLPAQPSLTAAYAMLPILFFGWVGLAGFLRNYVSDIVFWTAREGKSDLYETRGKILKQAVENLHHVLSDPSCTRLVVIGHSLGSSIGYQALLEIGKLREAHGRSSDKAASSFPYEKISHFITAGSPIETLHYFFELTDSKHHRYNRIADKIKGSIEDPPFTIGRKKNTNWINIHAAADPISSELFAPGKTKNPHIEELGIVSQLQPDIFKAHSGYFSSNSSISRIHDAIMLNDRSRTNEQNTNTLALSVSKWAVGIFHLALCSSAWLIFAASVFFWLGQAPEMKSALYLFFRIICAMILCWLILAIATKFFALNINQSQTRTGSS